MDVPGSQLFFPVPIDNSRHEAEVDVRPSQVSASSDKACLDDRPAHGPVDAARGKT
jgi:hypothetical protein